MILLSNDSYKLQISFHSIKWIMIESPIDENIKSSKNIKLARVVLDLLYVPLLFKVNKESVAPGEKPRENLERIQNIMGKDIDPHLLGLSKTILLEFRREHFSLTTFLNLSKTCKNLNKKCNIYYGIVDIHESSIDYNKAIQCVEAAHLPFSIFFAFCALFSRSYKVSLIDLHFVDYE